MSEEVLTKLERDSAVWMKIKAHLEKRLAAQRLKNDGDHSMEVTAKTRGRIAELKELLTIGEEQKRLPVDQFRD